MHDHRKLGLEKLESSQANRRFIKKYKNHRNIKLFNIK